jgi:hypothetical protein
MNYKHDFFAWAKLYLISFLMIAQTLIFAQNCASLPTFNVTLVDGQTITTSATWVSQNIRISGTVAFNAPVTMVGCTVLMDPGATLNVNSTFKIAALNPNTSNPTRTTIFACTTMWNAINVNFGASIEFSNSNIQGGISGIAFMQGYLSSTSSITGCIFIPHAATFCA